ncbi:MAG: ATP-binding protein, partial [Candidatus Bathyarchaeia archaeon]
MSGIHEPEEVGIIVSEATSTEFIFISEREKYPPRWEYLLVPSKEYVGGNLEDVDVLAQVERIISISEVLSENLDVEALQRIKEAGIDEVKTLGQARILGYIPEGSRQVHLPRRAVVPGQHIYVAPKDFLSKFFSYPEDEGLYVGNLISRPDVPVYLSVSGLRRHLAIIAQTGAGKSYCAGVLAEELLRLGASLLIIDPHADYVFLSLTQEGEMYEYADRITVFRNPSSTGRYSERDVGNMKPYEVAFPDLSFDEVCEVAGIKEGWARIRNAVHEGLERLRGKGRHYSPRDLLNLLEGISSSQAEDRELREGALSAIKYIRRLSYLNVFGIQATPIEDLLKPMHISVIDLSGLEDVSMNYIASRILNDAFNKVAMGEFPYPIFIIVEEAHKFVPREGQFTFSSSAVNKIAAEGRKFGVFLILITQRPSKIHPDSLSQCNSQIVMKLTNPQDQKAVAESSERMSRDLLSDLPGLNPGEAVIVGDITKAPVMVKIRQRRTREGGSDIDVVSLLNHAR